MVDSIDYNHDEKFLVRFHEIPMTCGCDSRALDGLAAAAKYIKDH
jgi:hypothetical protein